MSTLQYIIIILFGILAIHYLLLVTFSRTVVTTAEGFTGTSTENPLSVTGGAVGAGPGPGTKFVENPYDEFYAKVYDQLIQGGERTRFEVDNIKDEMLSKGNQEDIKVLVVGSGTGHHVNAFVQAGYKCTGMDASPAMISAAKTKYPDLEFIEADMMKGENWGPATFSHAFLPYFTIYYAQNKDALFKNLATWIRPGGGLCLHLVNKYKFDPILESASPFPAFSLQRYVTSRITQSDVSFDRFTYNGNFELNATDNNIAVFRETFKFKNGAVRVQEHHLFMPPIAKIIEMAERAGFKMLKIVDMIMIGYEYQYLVYFSK